MAGLQRAGGLIVTEDFATGQIKTFPLDAAQYGGALTLVNVLKYNDKRISAAANMLTDAHPDIDVNYVDVEDAKLATALMANEPGYDILMLSNYTLDDYRQSGVVLDISDCAAIWDVVDDCWIDMPYLIGPKRDAVPLYIMPQVLTINTDMYGVFDGDIERQPSSWSELYAQAQVIDESGTALISSNIRFPEFFDQYIVWCALKGEVNFDTALFRNGLLGWREAFENGIIVDFGEGDALLMGNVVGNYAGCDDIVLLPALDGETIYPCNTYSLVISCTSDKQDIAKEFLSYYVSVEAQSAADVNSMAAGLLKDSSLYVCSDPEFPQPTQEQQELRAHLLKYGASLSHNTDFYLLAGDQLELFMIGDIELDELVRTLNELYQMTQLG